MGAISLHCQSGSEGVRRPSLLWAVDDECPDHGQDKAMQSHRLGEDGGAGCCHRDTNCPCILRGAFRRSALPAGEAHARP